MSTIHNLPFERALFHWDFKKEKALPPLQRFTRSSSAWMKNDKGVSVQVPPNVPRLEYVNNECAGLLVEGVRTNVFLDSASFTGSRTMAVKVNSYYSLSWSGSGSIAISQKSFHTGLTHQGRKYIIFKGSATSLVLTASGDVQEVQLEMGGSPSTYIPTQGASVTRASDVLTFDFKDLVGNIPLNHTLVFGFLHNTYPDTSDNKNFFTMEYERGSALVYADHWEVPRISRNVSYVSADNKTYYGGGHASTPAGSGVMSAETFSISIDNIDNRCAYGWYPSSILRSASVGHGALRIARVGNYNHVNECALYLTSVSLYSGFSSNVTTLGKYHRPSVPV